MFLGGMSELVADPASAPQDLKKSRGDTLVVDVKPSGAAKGAAEQQEDAVAQLAAGVRDM